MNSTLLFLCIIVIAQLAYVVFLTHCHANERRELLDRIMAKDYKELQTFKDNPKEARKNLPNTLKKNMRQELKDNNVLK